MSTREDTSRPSRGPLRPGMHHGASVAETRPPWPRCPGRPRPSADTERRAGAGSAARSTVRRGTRPLCCDGFHPRRVNSWSVSGGCSQGSVRPERAAGGVGAEGPLGGPQPSELRRALRHSLVRWADSDGDAHAGTRRAGDPRRVPLRWATDEVGTGSLYGSAPRDATSSRDTHVVSAPRACNRVHLALRRWRVSHRRSPGQGGARAPHLEGSGGGCTPRCPCVAPPPPMHALGGWDVWCKARAMGHGAQGSILECSSVLERSVMDATAEPP